MCLDFGLRPRVVIIHHESQRLLKRVKLIKRMKDLKTALGLGEGRPEGRMVISIAALRMSPVWIVYKCLLIIIGVIYRYCYDQFINPLF